VTHPGSNRSEGRSDSFGSKYHADFFSTKQRSESLSSKPTEATSSSGGFANAFDLNSSGLTIRPRSDRWAQLLSFIQCWGSDPDPTLDLTPFISDFKDAKKKKFHIFSFNLPAGTLSAVLKIEFFAKTLC
jgi:hypothetical protein